MKKIALSLFVVAASGAYVWEQSATRAASDTLDATLTGDVGQTASPGAADAASVADTSQPLVAGTPRAVATTRESGEADDDAAPVASVSVDAPPPPAPQPPVQIALQSETAPSPAPVSPAVSPVAIADPAPAAPAPLPELPAIATQVDVPLPRIRPAYPKNAPESPVPAALVRSTPVVVAAATTGGYADGTHTGPAVDAYYGLVQVQAIVQGGQLVAIKVLKYPSDRRTSVYINHQALPVLRDEAIRAQSAKVDIVSGATLTSRAYIRSLGQALNKATS